VKDSQIRLGQDRTLAYTDLGTPGGACLFFCHGAPMSRLHLLPLDDQFSARGLRVITPDRPAYGGSSPQPGRALEDWPDDVAALADALGIERFLVAGHSSGGAYAVVCAARLPDRVRGAIIAAGVTNMLWPDAWTGYLDGRVELEIMRTNSEKEAIARATEAFGADGAGFMTQRFALPEPDNALLAQPGAEEALGAALMEAFRQGITAYAQDAYLEGRGWSFDTTRISAQSVLLHGDLDDLVPMAHSRHTASLIAGSTLQRLPGHGHLTILSELPAVAASLNASAA
jgi:pimeloyl-ACP methyl ester carboxylesterase